MSDITAPAKPVWVPFVSLAELSSDALVAFDAQGSLLQANAAFYQLLGLLHSAGMVQHERELDQWLGSLVERERGYTPIRACPNDSADLLRLLLPEPAHLQRTVRRVPSAERHGLLCLVHLRLQVPAGGRPPALAEDRPGGLLQRLLDTLAGPRTEAAPAAPAPLDLGALLQQVLAQLPAAARERPLSIEPVPPGRVALEAAPVAAALRELALNALAHSPEGSGLHLSWHWRCSAGRDQIGLALADHGSGMDPLQLADAGAPHSGLGRVRSAMARLGGELEMFSRPGHGTRACLWLPLLPPPAATAFDPHQTTR